MKASAKRLPAEWEPQSAVMLAQPRTHTDWGPLLPDALRVFRRIRETIERFEPVIVIGPDDYDLPINDTWIRDYGPLSITEGDHPLLLDLVFNGWGGKFDAQHDNAVTRCLHEQHVFGHTPLRHIDLILEGGSIESDGEGTLLTTTQCLLNNNRNPHLSKEQLEQRLQREFGAHRVLWLENGALEGDDTDAHVDTLARFAPNRTILYTACNNPSDSHYRPLKAMEQELKGFTDYRLLPLPLPAPKFDPQGERLPATYANFLVINGAVLVPTYYDRADAEALDVIGKAFPGREIIGIDCNTLILQHGSLHCATMQLPKGVL